MINYCTGDQIKADVGETSATYDEYFAALAESVSDLIDTECGREGRLYYRDITEYFDIEPKQRRFFPKNTPIVAISGHYIKDGDDYVESDTEIYAYPEYVEVEYAPYDVSRDIFNPPISYLKNKGLKIVMMVGFFPSDEIPKSLNILAREIASKTFYRQQTSADSGVKSKKIGNYSVTYTTGEESSEIQADLQSSGMYNVLDKYKKSLTYGSL